MGNSQGFAGGCDFKEPDVAKDKSNLLKAPFL